MANTQKKRTRETDTFEKGTQKQKTQANSEHVSHAPEIPRIIFLKELNLLDRFLFDEVMDDPAMHEMVLQIILHEDIHLLADNEVEKQLQTAPYLKSVWLDVFGVDEESVVYNTEMQKIRKSDLRKRSRFYQGLIDSGLLATGTPNYNLLNDSYIIMITPFDLFGLGLYQYTFRAVCEEEPGLKLGDGATRIFLNTKGTNPEDVSEELVEFLKYVERSDEATAAKSKSELVKKIHQRVLEIKFDEEIGVKYMQAWEEREYDRQEAREEGLAVGREEGREEGLTKGREEGREEGVLRVNNLTQKLIMDNRIDDLRKSLEDKEYQEKLFEEYGIK